MQVFHKHKNWQIFLFFIFPYLWSFLLYLQHMMLVNNKLVSECNWLQTSLVQFLSNGRAKRTVHEKFLLHSDGPFDVSFCGRWCLAFHHPSPTMIPFISVRQSLRKIQDLKFEFLLHEFFKTDSKLDILTCSLLLVSNIIKLSISLEMWAILSGEQRIPLKVSQLDRTDSSFGFMYCLILSRAMLSRRFSAHNTLFILFYLPHL